MGCVPTGFKWHPADKVSGNVALYPVARNWPAISSMMPEGRDRDADMLLASLGITLTNFTASSVEGSSIRSEGRVKLGGGTGAMVCTVVLSVERTVVDGKTSVRILRRHEELRSQRKTR